jgi:tRNA(Ile)-lysidine synthase
MNQDERHIAPSDTVVLAVSGGIDSMTLLTLFLRFHPREKMIIAHFDHSLRGEESDGDAQFVYAFCQKNGLMCITEKQDIRERAQERKQSIESSARDARYAFFSRICVTHKAEKLITAHHLDDRIETMLFNLIRGTKLSGVHALREEHTYTPSTEKSLPLSIIRPFIHLSK